ncbi:MAG: N-acetylmuramoyl-L-alanine amidase [Bacteroidetes bacterium]|nr:N-acetylmuramoyl-L-alanine amidase [Bacteroidota bacterium]
MQFNRLALFTALTIMISCSSNKYTSTNKAYKKQVKAFAKELRKQPAPVDSALMAAQWVGTTNFGLRKPSFVIIHHTAQNSCDSTLRTFTLPRTQVSAHYVICKDGTIHHMLNDYLRAWHAGVSKWGNLTDINSSSIGIELDNNGSEPFTDAQINSLLHLLKKLKKDNNIPTANFIGHSDIAPKRKVDPNKYFPWQLLAQNGFGYWYDTTNVKVPATFNAMQSLRIIGYDTRDTVAAIKAFKLHFEQMDSIPAIREADKKVIYDLSKKY